MTHDGTGIRPDLVLETVRICFLITVAILGTNFVFVEVAFLQFLNEQLPDATQPLLHGVIAAIP